MTRFNQLKLTRGVIVLFTLGVSFILYSAIPGYYYSVLQVQAPVQQQQEPPPQPPPRMGIKITSPTTGQQVPAGELIISGISTDNATTDCTVYADWNNTKPLQTAVATGPAGVNDYSRWTFTYTDEYHLITNGTNDLTSKLTCVDDSTGGTSNLTQFYSVNVIGVAEMITTTATPTNNSGNTTSTSEEVPKQQESPIIDSNITTIMKEITNVTTSISPEPFTSISTSPSVPLSPSIKEQQQEEENTTIYWDIE
jgi:hypothetical protein